MFSLILQLPLLIVKTTIGGEISNIRIFNMAIGENYGLMIESLSSLVNGKAIWCVLDYYFRKELSCSNKNFHETRGEESIMYASDYTDASKRFKVILACWQDITEQNYKSVVKPAASTSSFFPAQKISTDISRA
ncbi:uncharacterized protein LOC120198696 [Hibiscus syriacus]|uniref:uncharacterized protein LOC120198696 n=1 Tax=Hibiscus syriacus TaxID=106335 RepID=UPI001923C745|nr:uncharacterized protein LOC120198696 [Hibiscus syriacus]